MISLQPGWHECLVSLATTFPLLLTHLLRSTQRWGSCPHLVPGPKAGGGALVRGTQIPHPEPVFPAGNRIELQSEASLQGRWVDDKGLESHEGPGARPSL